MDEKVYIILLNYKGYEDTMECIKSLESITYKNYKIVIVDNNSPDDSYSKISKELKKDHILIKAEDNGGFAKGNNIGIKYALNNGADYILLINNDTLVEKNLIEELLKPFKREKNLGLTTGKIYYEGKRDTLWFAGGTFNEKRFYGMHLGEGEKDIGKYDKDKEITFSTGCLMMIKREVFEEIGYLPEEYFMYYEDVDYCLKLRQAGYRLWFNPKAVIYHKVSASTGGEASPFALKLNTRNRIVLMKKHKKNLMFFYATRIIVIIRYAVKGETQRCKGVIEGIKEGIKVK
ncbi:MAG: glycosyltransferase family 2 protein [Clostridium sp.]|uniref:glycosyltransferase family 2 protein n=1 Tax=Clostridium sp. TaxID=1506 RepID=UPI00302F9430